LIKRLSKITSKLGSHKWCTKAEMHSNRAPTCKKHFACKETSS
jgi:hypothetical protein